MRTTILLVEDEAVSRRALTAFLEDEGYSVEVVADGDAALRLLGDHHSFDAVITNLELGGSVDGLDVLKHFERTNPGRCKILISGNTVLESSCDLVGAAFLPKPVDLEKLLRTVRGSFGRDPSSQRE
jgi:two-component system cell cycle sensor histidine kinase/response regulator CckA